MKSIDWSKPIEYRADGNVREAKLVHVFRDGGYLVVNDHPIAYARFRADGVLYNGTGTQVIFNVPEKIVQYVNIRRLYGVATITGTYSTEAQAREWALGTGEQCLHIAKKVEIEI